jgi:hypothetical protein
VLGTISRQELLLADMSQELFSPELAIMEPAGDRAHLITSTASARPTPIPSLRNHHQRDNLLIQAKQLTKNKHQHHIHEQSRQLRRVADAGGYA